MEDKGLISALPRPLNNRQVIVTPLPQGLEAIQTFRSQVIRSAAQMLADLGPEDAREFIRIQKKLLANQRPTG